jgi:hypothetical protein
MIRPTIWTDIQRISQQVRLSLKFESASHVAIHPEIAFDSKALKSRLQPIQDPYDTEILRQMGYRPLQKARNKTYGAATRLLVGKH